MKVAVSDSKKPHPTRALLACALIVACSGQTSAPAESVISAPEPASSIAEPATLELPGDDAPVTTSPRPESAGDQRVASACVHWDAALRRVAEQLANAAALGRPAAESSEVDAALRDAGAPYVWTRAWTLSGGPNLSPEIEPRLGAWLDAQSPIEGERRCGGAVVSGPKYRTGAAVVMVDAVADLSPIPPRVRAGSWIEVEGQFLVPVAGAKVLALGPRGRPRSVPTSLEGSHFRARFSADHEGPWLIQVLGELRGGPRPVLEALVVAGTMPRTLDLSRAPGEDASSSRDEGGLLAMVNAARNSEGLRPLRPNPYLTALAHDQAQSIRASRRLAHDLGSGDPLARVEAAGLAPRLVGENVAHADTLAHAHRALWNSPSHRANLLDDRFDSIGIGLSIGADGAVWVSELFARLAG